jgi:succinate-acetate transporter protein
MNMTSNVITETNGHQHIADVAEHNFWRDHTTIALSPIAAPSILGLFGFAAATFMVAANQAGWYGNTDTPLVLFPFALAVGGVAQFVAGLWAYRARDALATAMHGVWGSFWIGYGIYNLLVATAVLPGPSASGVAASGFGFWFVVLAAITWMGTAAAVKENVGLTSVLGTLAAGSTLLAIALIGGFSVVSIVAGYVLVVSALLAWYVASAMMLEATYKRSVLPIGKRGSHDRVGETSRDLIQYSVGEPGVKVGQ